MRVRLRVVPAILVPLLVACSRTPTPPPAMAATEAAKEAGRQVTEVVWNQGQIDRLGEFYAGTIVRHVPERPMPIVGLEANQAYIRNLRAAFPDTRVEIVRVVGEGDWIAFHWVWTGTQTGDLPGLPATGRHVRLEGVSLDRMEHGKAAEIWDFDDQFSLLQQLGVVPPAPAAT